MDIWALLGYLVVSVLSGAFTAGLAVMIGGLGGLSAAVRRIILLEQRLEDVDGRITKEVKTRAAHLAVAAKADQRTAKSIAEEHLANVPGDSGGRPKVLNLIKR